ncbi:hypothetical protein [Stenotrophomonas maltophilia]|uniref:hypothetical protein n=1 Tax=Stenotrophomonas maltophilia TaxID=40324 RepID=UPI0021C11A0E|nr:hypothetical protein [Stenotrophomonas maltophilia]UXL28785.1 hypothetical protein N0O74_20525 [Stenotrophomonas maltophilia]
MTISVIRPFSNEDEAAVEKAAARFCKRHGIEQDANYPDAYLDVIAHLHQTSDPHQGRLWQACFCRAVGLPYDRRLTVAFGHLGFQID